MNQEPSFRIPQNNRLIWGRSGYVSSLRGHPTPGSLQLTKSVVVERESGSRRGRIERRCKAAACAAGASSVDFAKGSKFSFSSVEPFR